MTATEVGRKGGVQAAGGNEEDSAQSFDGLQVRESKSTIYQENLVLEVQRVEVEH